MFKSEKGENLDDDQPAGTQETAARLKVGVADGNCEHLVSLGHNSDVVVGDVIQEKAVVWV